MSQRSAMPVGSVSRNGLYAGERDVWGYTGYPERLQRGGDGQHRSGLSAGGKRGECDMRRRELRVHVSQRVWRLRWERRERVRGGYRVERSELRRMWKCLRRGTTVHRWFLRSSVDSIDVDASKGLPGRGNI